MWLENNSVIWEMEKEKEMLKKTKEPREDTIKERKRNAQRFVILRLLKLEIGKENYNSKREDLEEEMKIIWAKDECW